VARRLPQVPIILNDFNDALINLWDKIIHTPRMLHYLIRWTEGRYSHTQESFDEVVAIFNSVQLSCIEVDAEMMQARSSIAMAAFMIYLLAHGYNGLWRVNKKGEFNAPFGGRHQLKHRHATEQQLLDVSQMLRGRTTLTAFDFEEVIDAAAEGSFIYADPPYFAEKGFDQYTRFRFSADDQRRLAEALHRAADCGVRILSSNAYHPLIHDIYGWARIETVSERRSVGATGARRGNTPCVLIHYP
jgi:DNA adenine methylase